MDAYGDYRFRKPTATAVNVNGISVFGGMGGFYGRRFCDGLVKSRCALGFDPLGLTLTQAILTIGIYPLVVLVSKYILRLRKIGPADVTIG